MNKRLLRKSIESFKETEFKEIYKNLSFTVILSQPETSGNIGAIARVMKNFNFLNLIIFNPIESIENILSYETNGFAMHGKDVLDLSNIILLKEEQDHLTELKKLLIKYDLIIATSAKGTHYRNIRRLSIFPEDLTLPFSPLPKKIALLFGKESHGLTNDEIELADIIIRIPTSNEYPTLNLSHACGILLYELFKKINIISLRRGLHPIILADKSDRTIMYSIIRNLIDMLKIRNHKKENVLYSFKNVFERALISKKEASLIIGLFSKIEGILKNKNLYERKK